MRLPNLLSIAPCFTLAALLSGCTPEQGEAVQFSRLLTDAKLDKKTVTVTGVLGISAGLMGSTKCKAGRCDLELSAAEPGSKPPAGGISTVKMSVDVGSGENQMAELPDKYSKADVKVKAMGGKVLAAGDKIKVTGTAYCHGNNGEDRLPCTLTVSRIDPP